MIGMLTYLTPAASAQPAPARITAIASKARSKTGFEPRVPAGFREKRVQVGDVAINYVRGGHGPTLVLLHGYPQTW